MGDTTSRTEQQSIEVIDNNYNESKNKFEIRHGKDKESKNVFNHFRNKYTKKWPHFHRDENYSAANTETNRPVGVKSQNKNCEIAQASKRNLEDLEKTKNSSHSLKTVTTATNRKSSPIGDVDNKLLQRKTRMFGDIPSKCQASLMYEKRNFPAISKKKNLSEIPNSVSKKRVNEMKLTETCSKRPKTSSIEQVLDDSNNRTRDNQSVVMKDITTKCTITSERRKMRLGKTSSAVDASKSSAVDASKSSAVDASQSSAVDSSQSSAFDGRNLPGFGSQGISLPSLEIRPLDSTDPALTAIGSINILLWRLYREKNALQSYQQTVADAITLNDMKIESVERMATMCECDQSSGNL